METKVKTFEEFTGSDVKTPQAIKAYIEYLKKEGKLAWVGKLTGK